MYLKFMSKIESQNIVNDFMGGVQLPVQIVHMCTPLQKTTRLIVITKMTKEVNQGDLNDWDKWND